MSINYDCKVCEGCSKAMTAQQYWDHKCENGNTFVAPAKLTGPCCDNGTFDAPHECQKQPGNVVIDRADTIQPRRGYKMVDGQRVEVNKGGRPKGYSGLRAKMPSALAQAFKKAGLDWQADFAMAIKNNKRDRIKLWLKLLPYMITTSSRVKVKRWKGKPSKAALIALEAMENG